MKAKARRPRGGREPGGRGGSVVATGRRARGKTTLYIEVDDLASDAWRLEEAADILRDGGVGVIPTDTCYTFACDLHSRRGVERILKIKNEQGRHKPLTLLCKDISTMNIYARGIDKGLFKTMKAVLPGPYTFILPSTNEVPRMLQEYKHHKKTWKRKEIGIRLPDAPVLLNLLEKLDRPLLCGSVPADLPGEGAVGRDWKEGDEKDEGDEEEEDDDLGEAGREAREAWGEDAMVSGDPASIERAFGHAVDFVVDAGVLEVGGFSTIVDAVGAEPIVLREGIGNPSLVASD
ncbi:unnamed protein product [Ascophyllum nodosum]